MALMSYLPNYIESCWVLSMLNNAGSYFLNSRRSSLSLEESLELSLRRIFFRSWRGRCLSRLVLERVVMKS